MAATRELVLSYINELKEILDSVPGNCFEDVLNMILQTYDHDSSIFIMGNGGSGATASHFACDINKGASLGLEKRFKVMCLNDNLPTVLAYANDMAYEDIFIEQLKNFLKHNDLVIGISGSGNSKNVIKAIQYASENQAESVAFTGFDGGQLAKIAKTSIIIPSNDMQKVEDVHMILVHIIMQVLCEKFREKTVERPIHSISWKPKHRYTTKISSKKLPNDYQDSAKNLPHIL